MCISNFSNAQLGDYCGHVIDKETRRGIPHLAIEIKDQSKGVYTDENGYFLIKMNRDSIKKINVLGMEYEQQDIILKNFPDDTILIELKKKSFNLENITVKAKKAKIKTKILGKKKLNLSGGCYAQIGDEEAIFLEPDKYRTINYLKEVFVYVTNDGIPNSKFRIHVYEKDAVSNFPADDVTDSILIVHANNGNEWVRVDLSSKKIAVNKGIFISVEWVSCNGNIEDNWYKKIIPPHSVCRYVDHIFDGQVIGETFDYGVRDISCFCRHNDPDKWISSGVTKKQKNGTFRIDRWPNPMIYCTYTYE